MSNEPPVEVLDGETRLVFAHARSGRVIHQSWAETTFTAIPRTGERITLTTSTAESSDGEGQWNVEEHDRLTLLIKDIEYSYNYVHFRDPDNDVNAQRLLTDVWVYGEPLASEEEQA